MLILVCSTSRPNRVAMAASGRPQHPDTRWIVVVAAAICGGLHVWDLPAAIPFIRHDMAMTLVQAGALLGVVQVAGMTGGLAVSLLAEVAGERRCLLTGLALESLGSAYGAFAGSVTPLLASRMIEGAGSILIAVTGPGLIRRHTPERRLNTAIGYWGAFTGIAAVAGLAGSAVILQAAPWRLLWWIMTALTLAPIPLVITVVPADRRRQAHRAATAARRISATVRTPAPWLAGLAFACYTIQWMTVVGFLPTICAQNGLHGIWPGVLTALVAGVSAVASIGTAPTWPAGTRAKRPRRALPSDRPPPQKRSRPDGAPFCPLGSVTRIERGSSARGEPQHDGLTRGDAGSALAMVRLPPVRGNRCQN
jgi:MFS family permease